MQNFKIKNKIEQRKIMSINKKVKKNLQQKSAEKNLK